MSGARALLANGLHPIAIGKLNPDKPDKPAGKAPWHAGVTGYDGVDPHPDRVKAWPRNISARIRGQGTRAFRYRDWGALATIGRHPAVAQLPNVKLSGIFAWWFWLLLHIYFLIGFRSRLIVLINWAWSYFTYERGARIIVGATQERDLHGSEEKGSNQEGKEARSQTGT